MQRALQYSKKGKRIEKPPTSENCLQWHFQNSVRIRAPSFSSRHRNCACSKQRCSLVSAYTQQLDRSAREIHITNALLPRQKRSNLRVTWNPQACLKKMTRNDCDRAESLIRDAEITFPYEIEWRAPSCPNTNIICTSKIIIIMIICIHVISVCSYFPYTYNFI